MKSGRKLPILMYHHIGPRRPGTPATLTVRPERFREQVEWLAKHGYRTVTTSQWADACCRGRELPGKSVLLTMDDGYADNCEHALPVLLEHGFTATVFIVTGKIGGSMAWETPRDTGTHRIMTSKAIASWAARGIEFGSHTRSHPFLDSLSPAQVREEFRCSRESLAKIVGTPPISVAYPYGHWNDVVVREAAAFYKIGVTTDRGMNATTQPLLCLRRTMVQRTDTISDFAARVRWGHSPLENARKRWWEMKTRAGKVIVKQGGQRTYDATRSVYRYLTLRTEADDGDAVTYADQTKPAE